MYHHDKRRVRRRLAIRLPQSGVYFKSIDCLNREIPQGNSLSRLEISREAGWGLDEIVLNACSDHFKLSSPSAALGASSATDPNRPLVSPMCDLRELLHNIVSPGWRQKRTGVRPLFIVRSAPRNEPARAGGM